MNGKMYVLLPAYNEEIALPKLLKRYARILKERQLSHEIIIVDDGSTDNTREVVARTMDYLNVTMLEHKRNQGLGAALRTGFSAILGKCNENDVIVSMDADNTHDPQLIPEMMQAISNGADIVIASRYAPGGKEIGLSPMRKVLSRAASRLLNIVFRLNGVQDYTCGYRAYKAMIVKRGIEFYGDDFIRENGFTCMAEVLIKLCFMKSPLRINEVPLILRYDLKEGNSKMRIWRTIIRYVCIIWALRISPKNRTRCYLREQ